MTKKNIVPIKQEGIPISEIGQCIVPNRCPTEANTVKVKAKPAKRINRISMRLKI